MKCTSQQNLTTKYSETGLASHINTIYLPAIVCNIECDSAHLFNSIYNFCYYSSN